MAEVGVFTLENLTTGMYPSSLDALREYIQNSCDAIDKAVDDKILSDDSIITIDIDKDNRRITIEDNGTGIPVLDFKSTLTNIAYSDKTLETSRGFRGIGRLGGLAYCRELRFVSSAKNEGIQSTLIFNAAKLHELCYSDKKYTVKEALDEIISSETVVADMDEHFFRVELIDINETNTDLLDVDKVREYLSFVAPVTYSQYFRYQTEIRKHADDLEFKITEYKILVNGEQLAKNYKSDVTARKAGGDEIFGVDFRDIYNDDGKLIAWLWFGLSTFKGILSEKHGTDSNKMRGIRLRAGNIQIGDWNALGKLFKEKSRGTKYFIGEVHIVDTNLRPNGRRDYLEENPAYKTFEAKLSDCFLELDEIYRSASKIRNNYDVTRQSESESAKKSPAQKEVAKILQKVAEAPDSALAKVVTCIIEKQPTPPIPDDKNTPPPIHFPSENWSPDKRKLYSEIYEIIISNDKLSGDKLIEKFEEVLR